MKSKGLVAADRGPDEWQAQDDMRTLMRAAAIKADPKRLAAAKGAARKRLQEQQAETAQMRSLATPSK